MRRYLLEVVKNTFSLRFLVSLAYSFAYYIHEHVAWRGRIHAAPDVRIHATASIRCPQNVYVGRNSHINHLCCVWADEQSQIILGDNLLMGPGVGIFASNHSTTKGKPMTFQERRHASIVIGDDVWLGAGAIVLGGVTIGAGTVVGAGAVVTKSLPPDCVAVGVPARVVRHRGERASPCAGEDPVTRG